MWRVVRFWSLEQHVGPSKDMVAPDRVIAWQGRLQVHVYPRLVIREDINIRAYHWTFHLSHRLEQRHLQTISMPRAVVEIVVPLIYSSTILIRSLVRWVSCQLNGNVLHCSLLSGAICRNLHDMDFHSVRYTAEPKDRSSPSRPLLGAHECFSGSFPAPVTTPAILFLRAESFNVKSGNCSCSLWGYSVYSILIEWLSFLNLMITLSYVTSTASFVPGVITGLKLLFRYFSLITAPLAPRVATERPWEQLVCYDVLSDCPDLLA